MQRWGQVLDFDYDAAGRPASVTSPEGTLEVTYDVSTGRVESLTSAAGDVLAYGYDGPLMLSEVHSASASGPLLGAEIGAVSWAYDDDLRRVSETVDGVSVAFGYDGDGLLTSVGDETLVHAANSGLLTSAAVGEVDVAWTYDALGSLTSAVTEYDGDEIASFAYELDELGRIVTVTETVDADTRVIEYAYDDAGRLAAVDIDAANVAAYGYDGNGNRIEVTTVVGGTPTVVSATIDAQDRLVVQGDVEFEYAVTGELLSRSEEVLGIVAVTQYDHDAFGQLVAVELPDATLVEYERDARGRRVSRAIDGVVQQRWLYRSQLQVVAELDGAGDVVSRFVYGSNGHVPDLMVRGGSTYRLVVDHVGSVRLVVDVATGAIAQRLDYAGPGGPWGEVLLDTNPGFQPFGFAGGLYDAATGLVHFGAREYDPRIGRWISKDPVGFDGGTNHFAYCEGDPVNLIDPDGENPVGAAAAACAANPACAGAVAAGVSFLYAQALCFASGACKIPPFPRFDFDLRLPESCRPIADKLRDRVSRAEEFTDYRKPYPHEPPRDPPVKCWEHELVERRPVRDPDELLVFELCFMICSDGTRGWKPCPT